MSTPNHICYGTAAVSLSETDVKPVADLLNDYLADTCMLRSFAGKK